MWTFAQMWTLISALIVGVGVGAFSQFLKSRDEQKTHLDAARRAAYLDFAAAVKRELRLHTKMATTTHPDLFPAHAQLDRTTGFELLATAEDKRADLFEAILLLADKDTIQAAREWQNSVWQLRALHDAGEEAILRAHEKTSLARTEFYIRARSELGIKGLPPEPTLSMPMPASELGSA